MEKLERTYRRKIIESAVTGLTYHVLIETDFELKFHTIAIYDQNPDVEPEQVKVFGILPITIDPPPVEPIIERTYPLHADLRQKVAELIYRHELPMIRLQELDEWDGLVVPPKREPKPEAESMEEPMEEYTRNPEAEQEDEERKRYLRVKHWNSNVITVYDRETGRVWQEGEDDPEDMEDAEEAS